MLLSLRLYLPSPFVRFAHVLVACAAITTWSTINVYIGSLLRQIVYNYGTANWPFTVADTWVYTPTQLSQAVLTVGVPYYMMLYMGDKVCSQDLGSTSLVLVEYPF